MAGIDVHLVKGLGGLQPADPRSKMEIEQYGRGEIVRANLRKPRNGKHHRKAFSLLQLVFENLEMYPSFDAFLDDIKLKCGHYKTHYNFKRDGHGQFVSQVMHIPLSISFSAMSQAEFEEFYSRMFDVILDQYLPTVSAQELENQVLDYMDNWRG